jgi:hypothetical protein
MAPANQSQGLTCPKCSGVVPVPEGVRVVECPFCQIRCLVQGDRGIRRWQVSNRIERQRVLDSMERFFTDFKKARDLRKSAEVREIFLAYLPYWRVHAFVGGWLFGRVKSGKDSTKPVEVEVSEEMHWNDAATDVSEFGVHAVTLSKQELEPYDAQRLHAEGMVFEPAESATNALAEAESHFVYRGRQKRSLKTKYFEKFHVMRPQFSLVHYPLWIARYEYRGRNYQVVVDGVKGEVLYGKAPGNIFYRAAALVAGLALGNLILVNGTLLAALVVRDSSDDDGAGLLILPIVIGIGLIAAAYRAFRYGEEVETIQKEAKKAALANQDKESGSLFKSGLKIVEELAEMNK